MTHEISVAFQTNKHASQYKQLAQFVNHYDFDAVTVYCDAPFHPSFGPLLLMAPYIERARIGAAAIAPSRIHPIDIAAESALLAEVAQAGIYVGIARGAWLEDHGIQEIKPPIQAIRETVEIIRYLHQDAGGGYDGKVYQIAPHVKAGYPLPERPIPILIGSWGPKLCAIAGEIADEVKVGGSANPDIIPIIRDYIRVGTQARQRSDEAVGIVMGAVSVIDADREQARAEARRSVALYLPVVAALDPTVTVEPELIDRIREHFNAGDAESAAALISDDLLDRFAFAGNAADMIDHADRLFAAGASRVEFGTPHGLLAETGLRILGEQVIPELRRRWPSA